MKLSRSQSGFSLVELSIVLVILGLLTGGILGGQALIRAAELRAVSAEYSRWITATRTFQDKYFAIPGDMNNATRFWGRMNSNADCVTNSTPAAAVSAAGACDGNGGGTLDVPGGINQAGEPFQFWRQLALAGLIEGTYTGISGPANVGWVGMDNVPGTNSPRSKMSNAGWGVGFLGNYGGDGFAYRTNMGNIFGFGNTSAGNLPIGNNLRPEEAWNLDIKLDDGVPGTGRLLVRDTFGFGDPASCTLSANNTDTSAAYRLTNTIPACSLFLINAF